VAHASFALSESEFFLFNRWLRITIDSAAPFAEILVKQLADQINIGLWLED